MNITLNSQSVSLDSIEPAGWSHLVLPGEFPGRLVTSNGEETPILQIIDRQSLDEIVKNFHGKMLVDFEHRSYQPDGDSSAAAWISELQARPDGLWGKFEYTDTGRAAVENKRYRFLSPVFHVEPLERAGAAPNKAGPPPYRATRLLGAALTNRPNIKGLTPLSNSEPQPGQQPSTKGTEMNPEEIALALGLDPKADLAAILARAKELVALADAAKASAAEAAAAANRVAELEAAALNAEALAFVEANKAVIAKPDDVVKAYCANKTGTIALFAAMARPVAINTAAAQTPGARLAAGGARAVSISAQQRAAVATVRNREHCDHRTAWNIARGENPALFEDNQEVNLN